MTKLTPYVYCSCKVKGMTSATGKGCVILTTAERSRNALSKVMRDEPAIALLCRNKSYGFPPGMDHKRI